MNKNKLIRKIGDIIINSKPGSFWEDTVIEDLEISDNGKGVLLITKGWDNMLPFSINITYLKGVISLDRNEKQLTKDFNKKYE